MLLLTLGLAHLSFGQIWKKVLPKIEFSNNGTAATESATTRLPIAPEVLQADIQGDCGKLSSRQMGGRVMGSKGAELAGMYIGKTMNGFGVAPFAGNFVHTFWYITGKELTPETRLTVGRDYLFIPEDAFPAPYSATGEVSSYIMPDSREFGQPWIVPLYENTSEANDPGFDWIKATYKRAKIAEARGASAVLFYDNYGSAYAPKYRRPSNYSDLKIPVLIVHHKAYEEKLKPITVMTSFVLNIKVKNTYAKAANIVGYINNGAPANVLICAHYDGHPINENTGQIGGGANDNVSGVAAMMSLARLLKSSGLKRYNYIFAALSGGAEGQLGAKALLDDKRFDKKTIAYVLNFDRVGNLNAQHKDVFVNGLTSSAIWLNLFSKGSPALTFNLENQAVAVSDYQPFINAGIPALSFSTTREELPDRSKDLLPDISTSGIKNIVVFAYQVITALDEQSRPLIASKSVSELIEQQIKAGPQKIVAANNNSNRAKPVNTGQKRAAVTTNTRPDMPMPLKGTEYIVHPVGIVYDTAYNGYGVRILEIKKEEPADKAGLHAGDIIMQIGSTKINNVHDYIAAINAMKLGKKMQIKVKRGVTVQDFTLLYL
ncbi:MAG TPA: M28 family peptidase [Edaphocola sp.]|nr:M28 family peptidase [Edaphocola sp.]